MQPDITDYLTQWRYEGQLLLAVLAVAVVSFVGIFAFDRLRRRWRRAQRRRAHRRRQAPPSTLRSN